MSPTLNAHRAVGRAAGMAAVLGAGALAVLGAQASMGARAADPPPVYVTSTGDGPPGVCEGPSARRPCTLRDAIETVAMRESGRVIQARYCAAGDPGPYCLSPNDPNYDPARRVWRITLSEPYGFDITGTNVTIDFAEGAPGWASAADNAVEVATGDGPLDWLFGVDGGAHVLRGFNLRGDVRTAAVVLYNGASGVSLLSLAFADIDGDAIRIRDEHTQDNSGMSGIQCGWFGPLPAADARPTLPSIRGACLEISRGAHDNQIDDGAPGTNVFAHAAVGVRITGRGTRANAVRGATIRDNGVGVQLLDEAHENVIESSVIVGNDGNGIEIAGASWLNVIHDCGIGRYREGWDGDPAPNGGWGIDIAGPAKSTSVEANWIEGNEAGGVRVAGRTATGHRLSDNRITGHVGPGIVVAGGANGGITPPVLSRAGDHFVARACPSCLVEVSSDPEDEGADWVSVAGTDNSGQAVIKLGVLPRFRYLTAVTIDPDGNTSAYSAPLDLLGEPTPSARPTVSGLPEGPLASQVFLPVAWRGLP